VKTHIGGRTIDSTYVVIMLRRDIAGKIVWHVIGCRSVVHIYLVVAC
jgi:hypothetical protein